MWTRREALGLCGGFLVVDLQTLAAATSRVFEIHMKSDPMGRVVGFDPIGALLQPGEIVRWICDANVHTTTAYSPKNDNHSLRIPGGAQPWTSNLLLPGQTFEVMLTVEGVYDYFCQPHEAAGMVGRLIVGKPAGPGALPFDYFNSQGKPWKPVPEAAQKAFPSIAEILARKIVPSPLKFSD